MLVDPLLKQLQTELWLQHQPEDFSELAGVHAMSVNLHQTLGDERDILQDPVIIFEGSAEGHP